MITSNRIAILASIICALAACGNKTGDLPELTAARMPPTLGGLLPLTATQADVLAKFPDGKIGPVNFNDHPSENVSVAAIDASFVSTPPGKDGKVFHVKLDEKGACDWVVANIASLSGSRSCPGNRKTGPSGNEYYYCMRLGEHLVSVECSRDMPRATRDDGTRPPPIDVLELTVKLD